MFSMETICSGTFRDQGYKVTTVVVRLGREAMDEYLDAKILNARTTYATQADWLDYYTAQIDKQEAFQRKVCKMFGVDLGAEGYGGSVTQDVSEIFTVVLMEPEARP